VTATENALELTHIAARAAADKLATEIVAIDVSDQLYITDVFLIASADNDRQVNAVVDGIEEALLKECRQRARLREGKGEGHWVLLDFGDLIVHVFAAEDREFYGLENLWKDCPTIDVTADLGLPQTKADDHA
jgi:ribosome-associated protein